jgi:hypothetical protein
MPDEPRRTKQPRMPSRRTESRPFSPPRDARVAAAFDRGDPTNAWVEFMMDPRHPLPDWVRIGKLVAYKSNPGVMLKIVNITADPQHVYEMTLEWEPNHEGLEGQTWYKWVSNAGEPDFEAIFGPGTPAPTSPPEPV